MGKPNYLKVFWSNKTKEPKRCQNQPNLPMYEDKEPKRWSKSTKLTYV
jgi:hypothetical protein